MRTATANRRRGERGQVAGIEALPFGLLIFTVGTLLIVNLWGVVDSKFAADAAAREAARYIVEAAAIDADTGAVVASARAVAVRTMSDHGRERAITVIVEPEGLDLFRCQRVVVTVATSVPAIRLPFLGAYGDAFDVIATHTELVDPTRSGVGGSADCIR